MKKKKLAILMAAVLCVSVCFSGCYRESNNSPGTDPVTSEMQEENVLESMTVEEVRVAFLRNEIPAKDVFLASDLDYINAELNKLFLHYTEEPCKEYRDQRYFEPVRSDVVFSDPFSLDTCCDIFSYSGSSQSPVLLKFSVGNYDMLIGFDMWDIGSTPLSEIQWHPITAFFIPVSNDVLKPYAQYDSISIYIQSDNEDETLFTLKAIDTETGYSAIPPIYCAYAFDPHIYSYFVDPISGEYCHDPSFDIEFTMKYNGAKKVAFMDLDRIIVMDFSGELYYNEGCLFELPYMWYYLNFREALSTEFNWVDENTLEVNTRDRIFNFTMSSYLIIEHYDDGSSKIMDLPGPIHDIQYKNG